MRKNDKKEDPFKEYLRESEPEKAARSYAWHTAIGLQAVDGLKTSSYLTELAVRNIEGKITLDEAEKLLNSYFKYLRTLGFEATNAIFAENDVG